MYGKPPDKTWEDTLDEMSERDIEALGRNPGLVILLAARLQRYAIESQQPVN